MVRNDKNKEISVIGIWTLIFFLIATAVTSETIQLQTCNNPNYTTSLTMITLENNCIKAEFPIDLDTRQFTQINKLTGENIKLKIREIQETSVINNKKTKYDVKKLGLKGILINNNVEYTSITNPWIKIIYTLNEQTLKFTVEINNFIYEYSDGELVMETEIDTGTKGKITTTPPYVDGIKKSKKESKRQSVDKEFLIETLGRGTNIIIDPLFTIDFTPIPGTHLINGTVNTTPDNLFQFIVDITSGLSDFNDSTNFTTNKQKNIEQTLNKLTLKFEEISGTTVSDISGLSHDGIVLGTNLNVVGRVGSGVDLNGVNVNISVPHSIPDFNVNSNEDFAICLSANIINQASLSKLIDKDSGAPDGFQIKQDSTEHIDFSVDRATVSTILGTTALSTGVNDWHTICGVSFANLTQQLYLNNVFEGTTTSAFGGMDSDDPFLFGHDFDGPTIQNNDGKIDEVCYWVGMNLNFTKIRNEYEINGCTINDNQTTITGAWNQTFDPEFSWFAKIRKLSPLDVNITIQGYSDENTTVPSQSVSQQLMGTGWFNINITSIVEFETNIALLNFTKIRIFSDSEAVINELLLNKQANDTSIPRINNCDLSQISLGCGDSTILSCNVTDESGVLNVTFTVNNTELIPIQNNDNYTFNFAPVGFFNFTYNWTLVTAFDLVGINNTINPNLQFNYSCENPNIPPISFSLLNPLNNTVLITGITVFNWTNSIDLDNDTLIYTWELFNSSGFQTQIITFNLSTNITLNPDNYTWNVTVFDGGTVISATNNNFFFQVTPIPINFQCTTFDNCIDQERQCLNVLDINNQSVFVGNLTDFNQTCRSLSTSNNALIILCYVIAGFLMYMGLRFRIRPMSIMGALLAFFCSIGLMSIAFLIGIILAFFSLALLISFALF